MKKIWALVALLFALASQSVLAAESGFYGVVGVGQIVNKELPTLDHERNLIRSDGGIRTEDDTSLVKNFSLGYAFNKNWAVEGGYMTSDSSSSTTGSIRSSWGDEMTPIMVPYYFTQKQSSTAVHASAVGSYHMNDFVSLYGRLGMMQSKTTLEGRRAFAWPGNDGSYQGNFASKKSTKAIYGFGATIKMSDVVDLRLGLEHTDKTLPMASVVVRF